MSSPDLLPPGMDWIARLSGAVAGSAISLAYLLPRGRREAAVRFLTGVAAGLVFGATVGTAAAKKLEIDHVLGSFETILTGSALASLTIWWALGFATRMAETRFGTKRKNDILERKDSHEC